MRERGRTLASRQCVRLSRVEVCTCRRRRVLAPPARSSPLGSSASAPAPVPAPVFTSSSSTRGCLPWIFQSLALCVALSRSRQSARACRKWGLPSRACIAWLVWGSIFASRANVYARVNKSRTRVCPSRVEVRTHARASCLQRSAR